jgi:hypothetical protein
LSVNQPSEGPNQPTRGIPGRVFVYCFVTILLVIGGLMFGIGYRFQVVMTQLEKSRSLWPAASQELKGRYDRLANDESQRLSQDKRGLLTQLRSRFDSTSQFDTQSVAAADIERRISEWTTEPNWHEEDFEQKSLSILCGSDVLRKRAQQDSLGWLTVNALRLKLPPIFEPATDRSTR